MPRILWQDVGVAVQGKVVGQFPKGFLPSHIVWVLKGKTNLFQQGNLVKRQDVAAGVRVALVFLKVMTLLTDPIHQPTVPVFGGNLCVAVLNEKLHQLLVGIVPGAGFPHQDGPSKAHQIEQINPLLRQGIVLILVVRCCCRCRGAFFEIVSLLLDPNTEVSTGMRDPAMTVFFSVGQKLGVHLFPRRSFPSQDGDFPIQANALEQRNLVPVQFVCGIIESLLVDPSSKRRRTRKVRLVGVKERLYLEEPIVPRLALAGRWRCVLFVIFRQIHIVKQMQRFSSSSRGGGG